MVLTELNKYRASQLAPWPISQDCDARSRDCGMAHDDHDVALVRAPGVVVLVTPTWALVYDAEMLADAERRLIILDKLEWRRVSFGTSRIAKE